MEYNNSTHEKYMSIALRLAMIAYLKGEVPVGAIIVRNGKIISGACNMREIHSSAVSHAEALAIGAACKKINNWRLENCTLYTTLEPCPMCAGAIINSRIPNIVIGAPDKIGGACGSVVNLLDGMFNFTPNIIYGIKENECSTILKNFFKELRKKL